MHLLSFGIDMINEIVIDSEVAGYIIYIDITNISKYIIRLLIVSCTREF